VVKQGSVTINLEDYHALLEAGQKALELKGNTELVIKELQVFLSFMVTRADIEPYIVEFNKQSKTSVIELNDGIAKIRKK
tara:strand:+ start:226 stop:465 length:240 start_codon:yes stop_codon:yes gene_type:complete